MSNEELKPCPFCGETPSPDSHILTDGGYKYGAIQCGCGAQGPDVRTGYKDWPEWKPLAVAEWNTRDALSAQLAAIRADGGEVNPSKILVTALRQYMHNDGSGLVAGYEYAETQRIVAAMAAELERVKRDNDYVSENLAVAHAERLELRAELEAIKASGWRNHSVNIKRGEKCPQTLETAQAAWDRDQELIEDQRMQIAKQKQTINDLRQKLYAKPTA